MEILIRPATDKDVDIIFHIMHTAQQAMADPSAYITDDRDYIERHISCEGFCLMAQVRGEMAGFLMVDYPGLGSGNLGYYLGYSEQQLLDTAIMDSAAVLPGYQGLGIMGKMFSMAVERTEKEYGILLGTVHPDNIPSRHNFEKLGFTPQMTVTKPNGTKRLLMGKFT